ncbi:hypothetical protein, partial [Gemmobacter denitrificans]
MTSNLAHLAQSLDRARLSVLCLVTEVTKPQNSEAVTLIIAEARGPICKHPIAETTKPPAYPFIHQCQRAQTQKSQAADHSAPPQPCIQITSAQLNRSSRRNPVSLPLSSVPAVSVSRYLGPSTNTRKTKN